MEEGETKRVKNECGDDGHQTLQFINACFIPVWFFLLFFYKNARLPGVPTKGTGKSFVNCTWTTIPLLQLAIESPGDLFIYSFFAKGLPGSPGLKGGAGDMVSCCCCCCINTIKMFTFSTRLSLISHNFYSTVRVNLDLEAMSAYLAPPDPWLHWFAAKIIGKNKRL